MHPRIYVCYTINNLLILYALPPFHVSVWVRVWARARVCVGGGGGGGGEGIRGRAQNM